MDYKARPTTYAGVRFRSRLEARWAAFFDLCGWRWEYEPVDLAGWVPDFVLHMPLASVYCEVKPVLLRREGSAFLLPNKQEEAFAKATQHWREHQILSLGVGPQRPDFFAIGALADTPTLAGYSWADLKDSLAPVDADKSWREAGNQTQWRGQ